MAETIRELEDRLDWQENAGRKCRRDVRPCLIGIVGMILCLAAASCVGCVR